MATKSAPHIRWIIRRDMEDVLHIERVCFGLLEWKEDDFTRMLRQRNCIGMVAERNDTVVGYMIYELHGNRLNILKFAVDQWFQRSGVGTAMIAKLKSKLSSVRRTHITCDVRESNLDFQLFLKAMRFRAVAVREQYWDDTKEDSYSFVHHVHEVMAAT